MVWFAFIFILLSASSFQNSEKVVKDEFELFDTNKDGSISSQELGAELKITGDALKVHFETMDIDGNGKIEFSEFEKWLTDFLNLNDPVPDMFDPKAVGF